MDSNCTTTTAADTVSNEKLPAPSVVSTCPFVPSEIPSKSKRSSLVFTKLFTPLYLNTCPTAGVDTVASLKSVNALAPPDAVAGFQYELALSQVSTCPSVGVAS